MINKQLITGFTLLGFYSMATAGSYYAIPPISISKDPGWSVSVEALYLRPSNSDLTYALDDKRPDDSEILLGDPVYIKPKHQLGFSIKGQYFFSNTREDIALNYTHLHTSDSNSIKRQDEDIYSTLEHPVFNNDDNFINAKASVNFNCDTFDLLLGHTVNMDNPFTVHFAAGLRYAQIDTQFKAHYQTDDEPIENFYIESTSDYQGIGPRIESDGTYNIMNGFDAIAKVGGSILFGQNDLHERQNIDDDIFNVVEINKHSLDQIVPEIDAKLGLNYTHKTGPGYNFSIGLGWQWINYFDVRNHIRFLDDHDQGVYTNHVTDIGFNGPYLNIEVAV